MRAPDRALVSIPSIPEAATGEIESVRSDPAWLHLVVRYPASDAPVLPVGRTGELRVQHGASGQDLVLLGKVSQREDGDQGRRYHFQLGARARQALAPIFEPRRTDRVTLDGEVTLTLEVGGGGAHVEGVVRDLSTCGSCVEVPWEAEATLQGLETVEVTLRAEGRAEPLRFSAHLRSRRLGKGVILLGLEFEALQGLHSDSPEAQLEDWVRAFIEGPKGRSADVRRSA
jgi:hypothetical protein